MRRLFPCVCAIAAATPASANDGARWHATAWHRIDETHVVAGRSREPRANLLELERRGRGGGATLAARHRYDILDLPDVDGAVPATNGHVHRFSLAATWQRPRWRVHVEPVIAVSSNVARAPQRLRASDVLPVAAVERAVARNETNALWIGASADTRLGRWLPYPTVRRTNDPAAGTHWQLGFPESFVRRRLAPAWSASVGLAPDGAQWQVRDRGFEHRTRVRLRAWRAEAALHWQSHGTIAVELFAGRAFAGRLRYALHDGRTVALHVPDTSYAGARVTGRW